MTRTVTRALLLALLGLLTFSMPAHAGGRHHSHHDRHDAVVIGHRGASGYRPEHTLGAYWLAIQQGADFIEPDLVSTKDGYLVARHENEIGGTTDVSARPEFAGRKTTKLIDGVSITGWFTEDFTLAELKKLRAKERLPDVRPDNTAYDGDFQIPTLDEVILLAKLGTLLKGRTIGIYPETKHPTYFQSIGLSLEEPLVKTLRRYGYTSQSSPVIIQSFETANLRKLRKLTKVPLAQLLDAAGRPYDFVVAGDTRTYQDLTKPENLAEIAKYADGIGANKNLVIPRDGAGKLATPTTLIADAHAMGLIVHAWTFRRENTFLPTDFRVGDPTSPTYAREIGDLAAEIALFLAQDLDGFFTDNPDIGFAARNAAED